MHRDSNIFDGSASAAPIEAGSTTCDCGLYIIKDRDYECGLTFKP